MLIGSLFSGGGGLDMAVREAFDAEIAWHSEVDPAASKVLAHHHPDVPNLGDITAIDWATVQPVDIICGGFPCQDVSAAGRRAGLKNGTRTGLFANLMTAVETLRPLIVVLENVLGLLTADGDEWPDSVHALDRESARWGRVVALIEHKIRKAERRGNRDREWWHRKRAEGIRASRQHRRALAEFRRERLRLVPRAIATVLSSLAQAGYDTQWHCLRASDIGAPHQRGRIFILATDTTVSGVQDEPVSSHTQGFDVSPVAGASDRNFAGRAATRIPELGGASTVLAAVELLPTPGAADGSGGRSPGGGVRGNEPLLPGQAVEMAQQWGKYAPAIERWEAVTRPAPSPTEPNTKGNPRLSPAFPEWMMGWPLGWVTAVPGISRNDQLRIIGNGVCPQQAIAALRWLIAVSQVAA